MSDTDNRRIARNTVALYLRMFLSMIVGFYTSRVVLNTLGVEDYGTYGVVGSVVGMMGFLNASMAGATSRFITFELGRGDSERLRRTFASALIIHMGIALVVLVLAETIGLWFLCNKLVIPAGRMTAAHWVYQLSIVSACLGITQVPYSAVLIAHEKMDIYAYLELLSVTLRLLIVYLLVIGHFDKLILYAVLVFAVSVLMIAIYRIYCVRHFHESRFHWVWDKTILRPMLTFSGWDLYGNACVTARQHGINFLINIFFGVTYNAASAIASTVNGLILGLTFNVIQAFRPQIIKKYAAGEYFQQQLLMRNAVKFSLLLFACMLTPCILDISYLLKFWLKQPPTQSAEFCMILLFASIPGLVNSIITTAIHATGNIKMLSFLSGTLYLISVPITYALFKTTHNVNHAYISLAFTNLAILVTDIIILKRLVPNFEVRNFVMSIAAAIAVTLIASIPTYYIFSLLNESFLRIVATTTINTTTIALLLYFFILDISQRASLHSFLAHKYATWFN